MTLTDDPPPMTLSDDPLAGSMRYAFARPGIEGLKQRWGGPGGLSGAALEQKILDELTSPVDRTRRWFEQGACFAAGTMVHTKDGLKPIEQIQVGDWVLSKPENGGEQAYKRVVKTFAHAPQRVVVVGYKGRVGSATDAPERIFRVIATLNHPFWTKEEGWTAPSHIQGRGVHSLHFEDKEGRAVKFWSVKNIYVSDQPNVGWTSNRWPEDVAVNKGSLWDYAEHRLVETQVFPREDIANGEHPQPYFEAPVYNLEVEDFHTYYVGQHGIWVHNQNCEGWNLEVRNTIHPVNFINM